jgi:hypothetical protein
MEKARRREMIDRLQVAYWLSQAEMAEIIRKTTRTVQDLEKKGLPNRGFRGTKRYPTPHAVIWWESYHVRTEVYKQTVTWLDFGGRTC